MEWEDKALEKMKKVPVFVRGLAKRKVEEYVISKGRTKITEVDINDVKKIMFSKTGTDTKKLVSIMQEPLDISKPENNSNEKLYEVTGCNDKHLCPLSLIDANSLLSKLNNKLEELNITELLLNRIEGPVVYHHTFRVTVSECPNACSQPQIKDFGVIAEALPGIGNNECINCNLCVEECKEDAIFLSDAVPVIDYTKCIRCEACVKVCPVENTLITEKKGYSVFIAGKLGRHPQFAVKLLDLVDEDTVVKALEVSLNLYIKESKNNERFGSYVNRVGIDKFKEVVLCQKL